MRVLFVFLLLAFFCSPAFADGTPCAACQIVVALFQRLAIRYDTTIKNATQHFCDDLAPKFDGGQKLCDDVTAVLAPIIALDYARGLSPQHTCLNSIPLCTDFATCNLYTQWPPKTGNSKANKQQSSASSIGGWDVFAKQHNLDEQAIEDFKDFFHFFALGMGLQTERTARVFQRLRGVDVNGPIDNVINHLPILDLDGDRFSTVQTLRGSDWRGKDCDDLKGDVYPGRMQSNYDADTDHNCNGIYGTDTDGVAFEDKWCKDTGNLGVIAIGDSATAHFRIPPDYLDAMHMDETTYTDALPLAENEFDWPMCSSTTAHRNQSFCPKDLLDITSIYMKLRERNQCNHRDFQNLGVNGARTTSGAPPDGTTMAMKSRNVTDQPALVLYSMIGNDVCSGHHDFTHMTTPEVFEQKVLATLQYLETNLMAGSHVIMSGLVDGRILYENMHALEHPVGTTYEDVYDFLNCVEVSPCWGWMNNNATVRDMTSKQAALLNSVYPKIVKEQRFRNFDMFYIDTFFLLDKVVNDWVAKGNKASDLIEPTDGFHPSQTANTLLAENMWANLTALFPQAIGKVNPNNAAITAKFGDQGGY